MQCPRRLPAVSDSWIRRPQPAAPVPSTRHPSKEECVKRFVSVIAVIGLSAAGVAAGGVSASGASATKQQPATRQATIAWGTCDDEGLQDAGAVCGTLEVPLDYSHPNGTKIQLAVSMVRHTSPDSAYQGIMLTNPGGPGGSGLGLSTLGQFVPNGAGDTYDWIGFDPRGVGSSIPSLSCDPDYFGPDRPDYIPFTRAIERTWLARSKGYADACGADGGALLDHVTTIDSARDMDSIRQALGADQINYFGFSYGTYLAQVYATMFPDRVRRMVLDSNVDPRNVWYQANLNQDIAFERNIKIWFGWLAKYDSVYHLGSTEKAVEKLWYAEQNQLRRQPAGGQVGPDEWADVFLYAGYYQFFWLDLADIFAGWVHDGDADSLIAAYQGLDGVGDDNGFAMYNATQCTDVQWPQSWNKWRVDNWITYFKAPFFTWGNAWYNAPCVFWPASAHKPLKINGRGVASVLLIDETLDAATPFEGSLEVRKLFPNSSLIAEPGGTTHAGTLFGNACVDDQIAAYLADGKRPARVRGDRADTFCDPLPQPVPEGATAAAVKSAGVSASASMAAAHRAMSRAEQLGRLLMPAQG
jgi:pimeloyl-ACP methyl ester carboxylesterase